MKTKLFKSGLTLLLLAVFITASTLLLNGGITKVQSEEDGKVITASAAPSLSISIAAVLSSAVGSEPATASAGTEQTGVPNFTVTKPQEYPADPNKIQEDPGNPGDKDLTFDEAARVCAKALRDFMNVNLTNGNMTLYFCKNNSGNVNRDMWKSHFITADNMGEYSCNIDSVTGQVYNLADFSQALSSDTLDKIDINAPPVPGAEEARQALLKDERYTIVACNYIKSKFPDKTITSAVNMFNGSMGSGDATWVDICVAVELSDGTGYMVKVGDNTLDVLCVDYYTNGVASFYSTR